MRLFVNGFVVLGMLLAAGCVYSEPRHRVVYRDVIAPDGTVIEHDRYVEAAPAPIVEVVPVRPYPAAIWVRGYWVRRSAPVDLGQGVLAVEPCRRFRSSYNSPPMRTLITAGPTREPIDMVRYIGNRSSGRMGAALARAAFDAGHEVTLLLGPVSAAMPAVQRRIDVETAAQMHRAVLDEFPHHDLLIMAAAVADYRPIRTDPGKLGAQRDAVNRVRGHGGYRRRRGASQATRGQRTVGFSLELRGNLERSRAKLARKHLDLIVYNPTDTMNSATIEAVLIWADRTLGDAGVAGEARFRRYPDPAVGAAVLRSHFHP